MLSKLNTMYDKEKEIINSIDKLNTDWVQLQEDKDMLQTMIMYQSNKENRYKK